jgi:hypothetical protein
MASGPWTRQRESPATTLDARPRAAQPSRQPPHAHAGPTPVARGARAAPGLRWAVAAPARGGVCTVGTAWDATGVVGDETGPVSVVSSREARCEAWRGSDVRHRGPRSASPRPPWSQTRVRRRTRDETEVRGGRSRRSASEDRARPRGARAETPSPYREGIQQLCVCAFFHSLTRLM